jgi:succinyl-diaminopimelate desuccinylase
MDAAVFDRVMRRIDSLRDDMIRLQIDLTAIPALAPENGGDGEYRKSEFLKQHLFASGYVDIRTFSAPDDRVPSGLRPNLVAIVPGKDPSRTIWILTHLDVVPPGKRDLWNRDPYEAYVDGGRIYGRGTEDNQQDVVASVFAARALLDEGVRPERSVGLVFVADEETGSDRGLKFLLETQRSLFRPEDLIVVPDAGSEDGSKIEVAEKSLLWLRFKTSGKQCHASRPALGRNAFLAASHLIVRLSSLHGIFDRSDPLFDPPESTFEPTRKDANVPNINTIPGEDIFYIDCRILPAYRLSTVLAEIRKMADDIEKGFDVAIDISAVQEIQAPEPTPPDAPVVIALDKSIKAIYGVTPTPIGIGGGTVAATFRKYGYPAAVWSRLGLMAHQPNEYCLIANMIGNAKVYAHLFLQG